MNALLADTQVDRVVEEPDEVSMWLREEQSCGLFDIASVEVVPRGRDGLERCSSSVDASSTAASCPSTVMDCPRWATSTDMTSLIILRCLPSSPTTSRSVSAISNSRVIRAGRASSPVAVTGERLTFGEGALRRFWTSMCHLSRMGCSNPGPPRTCDPDENLSP